MAKTQASIIEGFRALGDLTGTSSDALDGISSMGSSSAR